jgi:dimethylargininase
LWEVPRVTGLALVRAPDGRLGEGCYRAVRPVDPVVARRQHEELVGVLDEAGWKVEVVRPENGLPDAVFVGDMVIVRGGLAILARPGDARREAELAGVEEAVRALGLEVVRPDPPGTLEGGDVIQTTGMTWGDTVYVGRSPATSEDAACRFPGLASGSSRAAGIHRVVSVEVSGCRQLVAAMSVLPDGTLFGLPDRVDTSALPGLRVAPEPSGAQVVVVGERHVMLPSSAPRTAALLASEGYRVTTVDMGEFEAVGGCLPGLAVLVAADDRQDRDSVWDAGVSHGEIGARVAETIC